MHIVFSMYILFSRHIVSSLYHSLGCNEFRVTPLGCGRNLQFLKINWSNTILNSYKTYIHTQAIVLRLIDIRISRLLLDIRSEISEFCVIQVICHSGS
jgi:hypothetical protein